MAISPPSVGQHPSVKTAEKLLDVTEVAYIELQEPGNKLYIDVSISNQPTKLQVDTGAAVSLLNSNTYTRLGAHPSVNQPDW